MPELPEVETLARQLRSVVVGRTIAQLEVLKAKSWQGDMALVLGQRITDVSRRAKILHLHLENGLIILVHLKMSGQMIFVDGERRVVGGHPTADWIHELPSKHTRIAVTFIDGTHLYFNDQRMFGWWRLVDAVGLTHELRGYGPDIIDPQLTPEYFIAKARGRRIPIKVFIMDHANVSGVGNIYACDALNLARISPLRPTGSLSEQEWQTLFAAMKTVIHLGIELGGATVHGKYAQLDGLGGHYQDRLRVYQRDEQPCPNCGQPVKKIRLAGRGTFYCSACQI